MKFYQDIIQYIFENPRWINKRYVGNAILISEVPIKQSTVDVVILDDKIFFIDDVSEYIEGQIFGGTTYNKNFEWLDYYTFINKEGKYWGFPEYKFKTWNYYEGQDNLFIQDIDNEWYSLGKETNYKLVKQ